MELTFTDGKTAVRMGSWRGESVIVYRKIQSIKRTHTRRIGLRLWFEFGKIGVDEKHIGVYRIYAIVREGKCKYRVVQTQWSPLVSMLDMLCDIHRMGVIVYA